MNATVKEPRLSLNHENGEPGPITYAEHLDQLGDSIRTLRWEAARNVFEPSTRKTIGLSKNVQRLVEEHRQNLGSTEDIAAQIEFDNLYCRSLLQLLAAYDELNDKHDLDRAKHRNEVMAVIGKTRASTQESLIKNELILSCLRFVQSLNQKLPGKDGSEVIRITTENYSGPSGKGLTISFQQLDQQYLHPADQKLLQSTFIISQKLTDLEEQFELVRQKYYAFRKKALQALESLFGEESAEALFRFGVASEEYHMAQDEMWGAIRKEHARHIRFRLAITERASRIKSLSLVNDALGMERTFQEIMALDYKTFEFDPASKLSTSGPSQPKAMSREEYIENKLRNLNLTPGHYTFKSGTPGNIIIVDVNRNGEIIWKECPNPKTVKPTMESAQKESKSASSSSKAGCKTEEKRESKKGEHHSSGKTSSKRDSLSSTGSFEQRLSSSSKHEESKATKKYSRESSAKEA